MNHTPSAGFGGWQPTVREAFVDTPVARIHYARAGDGPPVLLIPGSGGWKLTFAAMIKELAHGHTVFAADPPGQGRTEIVDRSGCYGAARTGTSRSNSPSGSPPNYHGRRLTSWSAAVIRCTMTCLRKPTHYCTRFYVPAIHRVVPG